MSNFVWLTASRRGVRIAALTRFGGLRVVQTRPPPERKST